MNRRDSFATIRRFRRPSVLAVAAWLLALHLLPGAEPVQWVELVDGEGKVESAFAMAADDPRLDRLREQIAAHADQRHRLRGTDYYHLRWQRELAAFYASDSRIDQVITDAAATGESQIQQVSFAPSGEVTAARVDWTAYWNQRVAESDRRLRELERRSHVPSVLDRLRFGAWDQSEVPISSVALACLMGAVAFHVGQRSIAVRPRPRIGLRGDCVIHVPRHWVWLSPLRGSRMQTWTWGTWVEAAAVTILVREAILAGCC